MIGSDLNVTWFECGSVEAKEFDRLRELAEKYFFALDGFTPNAETIQRDGDVFYCYGTMNGEDGWVRLRITDDD